MLLPYLSWVSCYYTKNINILDFTKCQSLWSSLFYPFGASINSYGHAKDYTLLLLLTSPNRLLCPMPTMWHRHQLSKSEAKSAWQPPEYKTVTVQPQLAGQYLHNAGVVLMLFFDLVITPPPTYAFILLFWANIDNYPLLFKRQYFD